MSKFQFTGTATQPQRNRKLCQFNNDQYCSTVILGSPKSVGTCFIQVRLTISENEIRTSMSAVIYTFWSFGII